MGGLFFLELQKDWDEKNLIKDTNRNDKAEYSHDYTAPFPWFEGPNYSLSCTTNLNIKALSETPQASKMEMKMGTSNQMLLFQVSKSPIINKLLIQL